MVLLTILPCWEISNSCTLPKEVVKNAHMEPIPWVHCALEISHSQQNMLAYCFCQIKSGAALRHSLSSGKHHLLTDGMQGFSGANWQNEIGTGLVTPLQDRCGGFREGAKAWSTPNGLQCIWRGRANLNWRVGNLTKLYKFMILRGLMVRIFYSGERSNCGA